MRNESGEKMPYVMQNAKDMGDGIADCYVVREPEVSIQAKSIAHAASIRQIVLASSIGSFIDWYDFLIAATAAALVWPTVFFKFASGPVAAGLSLISFVGGNFARPIGAFVFGNIGDRLGRRSTLTLTLVTMGVATFGIGLTPGYADAGWAAPALLLFWRLIFGVGVGGEWGGATAWIAEFASESRWRAFWNGFNAQVLPLAVAISAVSFPIVAAITGSGFMTFAFPSSLVASPY
jgi:MFS family permease